MPATTLTVQTKGIYHHLPTFPAHDGKKYSAIVTGANGISGSAIVDVLAGNPERWETIYAISRRPPVSTQPHVKAIAADFLSSPEDIAELLRKEGVKASRLYILCLLRPTTDKSRPGPLVQHRRNGRNERYAFAVFLLIDTTNTTTVSLLSNFLSALTMNGTIPTRFLLQTGGKHYALHLGPTKLPMSEDFPRIPHPNFYFPQEDALSTWCLQHHSSWTVTRPGFIIGAVKEAFINITYALAIYATIQKELGLALEFPADIAAWDVNKDLSVVKLIAYHAEWAVLTEGAANQALNIVDDSRFSWGAFWPILASWYEIPYGVPELDEGKYARVVMPDDAPRGFGGPGVVSVVWSFERWAGKKEVRDAWERVQEREGLDVGLNPWRNEKVLRECFATLDAEILGGWGRIESMDKSRRLGWSGWVDTKEGIRDAIEQLAELKMVPNLK
ncbi:Short chain dehydrogenase [Lachnellula subtilissima]|uniref:Short chain dehydrogenase n=1 Tax=Lachnellula subtilissima TaxID=602034 RepID=A0A8H8S2R6_9HELO|nr:Short chain dehydrogenase [Lachnellula subtilissima]